MLECSEESWRSEVTCCHLDSSEKPLAKAGMKIHPKWYIDYNNNNNKKKNPDKRTDKIS